MMRNWCFAAGGVAINHAMSLSQSGSTVTIT
jgi:hypothetical protein